jgi:hypothetical protein
LKILQRKLLTLIHTGSENEQEYRENERGGNEPMNPKDIAEHEPTAVKRDKNQGTSDDAV